MNEAEKLARGRLPTGKVFFLSGLLAALVVYPAAQANSQSGKSLAQLTEEITVLRADSIVQKRQIARLEAQVLALDSRAGVNSRDYNLGNARHRKITLQTMNGLVNLDNDAVLVEGRNITVKGRNIVLSGDSIRLDANSISTKGGGDITIKGGKIGNN